MNVKRLAFWALLCCGLLVYVLLFELTDESPREAVLPAETYPRVFALETGNITGVLVSDGEASVRLVRQGREMHVAEPAGAHVSADLVESLLSAIAGLVIIDEVEPGEDLVHYGLDPPAFILQVSGQGGDGSRVLLLGANTPSTISMYAYLPQQNRTVLLGTYLRFALRTFLENVRLN